MSHYQWKDDRNQQLHNTGDLFSNGKAWKQGACIGHL